MKQQIGVIGLVVGLIAVGIAIFQDDLRSGSMPEKSKESLSLTEVAVEAGKNLFKEKILKQEPASSAGQGRSRDAITLTYLGLGFLAIVLGVVSWVKKDHIRVSGSAVGLGLIAVAWQYVLIGVVIAVVIYFLAFLADS
jgi:uncharacterized membrane protein YidH (DUF202 family)